MYTTLDRENDHPFNLVFSFFSGVKQRIHHLGKQFVVTNELDEKQRLPRFSRQPESEVKNLVFSLPETVPALSLIDFSSLM
ncbi:hypothetical protein SAMN05192534_12145 [Alteribacillus persepolensis]|uniref:Uncharacterized protein n=1 Tax=Alteribacillus persepolensis TaxID=568899 RepID=A0A1G8HU71_9BACI|nr:hypothetical protein SAMN05192534_12145 [Alteribacillus persepolensis]